MSAVRQTIAMLVPAYNAAHCLPRLLESAARQTRRFDEVLVYDDCSTDNTSDVAAKYNAVVVRGEKNRGCSHGKNLLAAITKSDWIHFHDADDELYPNFVLLATKWAINGSKDVVLFPYEERDDITGRLLANHRFDHDALSHDARSYAIRNQINPFCGLYRRESFLKVGGYDEDPLVLYNEDVAMHIKLAFSGLSFGADSEISIINHRRENSMSGANPLRCLQAQAKVMEKAALYDAGRNYDAEIAERLWGIIGGLSSQLDWKSADAAVDLALRVAGERGLPKSFLFGLLCRVASPHFAIRVREWSVRIFKSRYRDGYPGWRFLPEASAWRSG